MDNAPPWVVIVTKASAEEVAERSLRQAGYRVYLPRYRKARHPHGQGRRVLPAMRPLFAGFVFVQDWHGWPPVSVVGTVGLMKSAGRAVEISEADIALLCERERSGRFDELPPPRALVVGDRVEMDVGGAYVLGVLDTLSDSGKAVVRALLFNRETTYRNVDAAALRVVDA